MNAYLSKPIDPKKLYAIIGKYTLITENIQAESTQTENMRTGAPHVETLDVVFKKAEFLEATGNNIEIAVTLIKLFLDEKEGYQKGLTDIQTAISINDANALRESAHSFKGMITYFSDPGREAALTLENMGRNADRNIDIDQAQNVFSRLKYYANELAAELNNFINETS